MKLQFPLITAACIAAISLSAPATAPAKEKKTNPAEAGASASPAASAAAKPKPIAYHGKVAAVDAAAKTFTVGSKTIKVTDKTKITNKGAAATMADIVADEQVRGSYWKKEDGTLEAKSVKLGAKSAEAKPTTDAAKPMTDAQKKEGTEAAAPAASP